MSRCAAVGGAVALLALASQAGQARPARSGQITISMLATTTAQPAFSVLIPNFERVYPNITVDATYVPSANVSSIEGTELAAGNAPDLLATSPGRSGTIDVYELARAGDLAPMVDKPWAKRSLPLVTSLSKVGAALYMFEPAINPFGIFTNNALFTKLGLKVPQTFSQLLALCQKAKADGTVALEMDGGSSIGVEFLLEDLAVATVYGPDPHFTAQQEAGTATFDGAAGWHQALQEFIDMSNAGCFQPGMTTASQATEDGQFAQGQALMDAGSANHEGTIVAAQPQFSFSFSAFPGGTGSTQARTAVFFQSAIAVDAHSSAENQAAAQSFVDFIARPKQDALFAQLTGTLTQYEFLKGELPSYMAPFAPVVMGHEYYVDPMSTWWNPAVAPALSQNGIGLVTGQNTIDDVLNTMDAAWKQGPS